MFLSLALIIISSLFLFIVCDKIRIPRIIAMLCVGIVLGPYVLNLIDESLLSISLDIRKMALIVILIRAGFALDLSALKKVGRPAILLSFIPASIEMLVITLLAPVFFDLSYFQALVLGSIVAAVSPAIVIPRMLKYLESGHGKNKNIPQMILAAASMDDIFVIIIFTSLMHTYVLEASLSLSFLWQVPLSIGLGILLGAMSGIVLNRFFKKFHLRDTYKILIIFAVSFLMVFIEEYIKSYVFISALIFIVAMSLTLYNLYPMLTQRLNHKLERIWVLAELLLFVFVGAAVNIHLMFSFGFNAIILLMIALCLRAASVFIPLIKTPLNVKERCFVSISYIPKATVQAAIGSIPLALGMPYGDLILSIAVLSIIITAPIGAFMMDLSYQKLLSHDKPHDS